MSSIGSAQIATRVVEIGGGVVVEVAENDPRWSSAPKSEVVETLSASPEPVIHDVA